MGSNVEECVYVDMYQWSFCPSPFAKFNIGQLQQERKSLVFVFWLKVCPSSPCQIKKSLHLNIHFSIACHCHRHFHCIAIPSMVSPIPFPHIHSSPVIRWCVIFFFLFVGHGMPCTVAALSDKEAHCDMLLSWVHSAFFHQRTCLHFLSHSYVASQFFFLFIGLSDIRRCCQFQRHFFHQHTLHCHFIAIDSSTLLTPWCTLNHDFTFTPWSNSPTILPRFLAYTSFYHHTWFALTRDYVFINTHPYIFIHSWFVSTHHYHSPIILHPDVLTPNSRSHPDQHLNPLTPDFASPIKLHSHMIHPNLVQPCNDSLTTTHLPFHTFIPHTPHSAHFLLPTHNSKSPLILIN